MDLNLNGKIFLVTGGASGIGAAIVTGLVSEGAHPVIIDRDTAAAQTLISDLESGLESDLGSDPDGASISFVQGDLSTIDGCRTAFDAVVKDRRRLHGVINCAGGNDGIGLENGSPEQFERSLKQNLNHYYHICYFALPYLKETAGAIVNISSKTAVTGQGGTSAYVAAKGAQLALTREWAVELLPHKIRVNAVVPAEVMTPMYQRWLGTLENGVAEKEKIENAVPLGQRMTRPEEIADAVLFLLSERASHITGQHLFVDGGYTHLDRRLSQ